MLRFIGGNYQDTKILIQAKLFHLVDKFLLIRLYNFKYLHARDAIKLFEQIFLFLSFKHVGIF